MIFHDAIGDGETQTGSAGLRRIERFKHPRDLFFLDADPRVSHRHHEPAYAVGVTCLGRDAAKPAVGHGMKRIDDEVHQNLTDRRLVAQNGRQRFPHRLFEADLPLLRLKLHQRHDVLDQGRDVHLVEADRPRAGELHEVVENDREAVTFCVQDMEITRSLLRQGCALPEFLFQ